VGQGAANRAPGWAVTLNLGTLGDDTPDDGEPVALAASAAPAADVASLYRAESPRLLRFFRRRTTDFQEAQDLVHETFARVLGSEPRHALRKPEAYLTRIAQNLMRDRAKTRARRSADRHVPADETILAGTDQNCLLETRDLLDRLELAMLELPQQTREIFMGGNPRSTRYS